MRRGEHVGSSAKYCPLNSTKSLSFSIKNSGIDPAKVRMQWTQKNRINWLPWHARLTSRIQNFLQTMKLPSLLTLYFPPSPLTTWSCYSFLCSLPLFLGFALWCTEKILMLMEKTVLIAHRCYTDLFRIRPVQNAAPQLTSKLDNTTHG